MDSDQQEPPILSADPDPRRVRLRSGSTAFSGRLINAGFDGLIRVLFPVPGGPALAMGEEVSIELSGGIRLGNTRARSRSEGDGLRTYELQAVDPVKFEKEHWPLLSRLLDRRRAARVRPARDAPISVRLQGTGADLEVSVPMINVSTTGMALRVPPEVEVALRSTVQVTVAFALPPAEATVTLPGVIRYRSLVEWDSQYGIEFDDQSTGFEQQQSTISGYVTRRQNQILGL